MDAAIRELQGAIKDLAARVENLEKWIGTRRACDRLGNKVIIAHSERLDTLCARIDLLQPRRKDMVACPACQEGLVFTPGDADDPPSHDRCQLCEGTAEVSEGVAAYVGRLQRDAQVWEQKARTCYLSWERLIVKYDKEVTRHEEEARLARLPKAEELRKALNG